MNIFKILLSVLMLQVSVQVHSNSDALADLVTVILGAKLIEGVISELTGENEEIVQENTSPIRSGSLGFQYYNKGLQQCKNGEYEYALQWFNKSKEQGYLRAVNNVFKSCSGKSVQDIQTALKRNNLESYDGMTGAAQDNKSSFSDLWTQSGGQLLDSNPSNKTNTYNTSKSDTLPPLINLNHSDSMLVNGKRATISGVVKDGSDITELLIKGRAATIDENGNFSISRYVRLGRNVFDIVALDAFGNKSTKVVTITRKKEIARILDKPLDLPSFQGKKDKSAVALIIGLDKYESIASAPWAESDASVFYDYAQQSLGISANRIALITGNKSDRSGIWKSLDRWLPAMVEKNNSNVYVYFAGHGLASADGREAYLLPYDGDPDMLDRTAIPREEVINGLKNLKARSVTLFMDTCYSGTPKGGKGTLVADSRGLRIIKKSSFSSLPKNFTIFSAASNDETASSHPTQDNGLFSYWMMRGLGGEADGDNDRKITNGELHEFINKNVKKAAVSIGRKQNSQLLGDEDRVIASW